MDRRAALAIALLASACVRDPAPPPPPPAAPSHAEPLHEEDLQPDPTIRLEIIDLRDTADASALRVTVTGTLINRGTKATSQVSVKVHALDEHGDTIASLYAVPTTDRIPANGGTAKFTVGFESRPAIRSYHVEAVAR